MFNQPLMKLKKKKINTGRYLFLPVLFLNVFYLYLLVGIYSF